MKKKAQMERKGKIVKASSKYTGRRRGPKFWAFRWNVAFALSSF
jgi:hypothetical protein